MFEDLGCRVELLRSEGIGCKVLGFIGAKSRMLGTALRRYLGCSRLSYTWIDGAGVPLQSQPVVTERVGFSVVDA